MRLRLTHIYIIIYVCNLYVYIYYIIYTYIYIYLHGYKDGLNLLDFDREFLLDLLRCSCVVAGPGVGSPWSASNGQAPRILPPTGNMTGKCWEYHQLATNSWLMLIIVDCCLFHCLNCLKNFLRNEFWLLVSMPSWCLIKWVEPQLRVFEMGRNRWQDVWL